ncbi:hypothetical protein [Gilvibacter sediminis]|uniref:hypothetical protein n=1 Tax=Gilvibacter sediminis TaxID=379071 RepID=UPI00234FC6D2|nr:hypothetical protein [Gilvibacter sediminis]MDC7996443.1 hypothetical protein [Gilvibacter sediminis]
MSLRAKNIISLLFLSAFLLLRVGNAHAVTHLADDADLHQCELCELIQVTEDSNDLDLPATVEIPLPQTIEAVSDDLNSDYAAPVYRYVIPDRLRNRPPPVL